MREKIASLYSEVVGYAGKPSGAQLANLNLLKTRMVEANSKVETVVKKSEALNKQLLKAKIAKTIVATLNEKA